MAVATIIAVMRVRRVVALGDRGTSDIPAVSRLGAQGESPYRFARTEAPRMHIETRLSLGYDGLTIEECKGDPFIVSALAAQATARLKIAAAVALRPPAGPWIRDYVNAVRAVWDCWQTGEKLEFASEHYRMHLMVPLFDPGPIAHPDIPIAAPADREALADLIRDLKAG